MRLKWEVLSLVLLLVACSDAHEQLTNEVIANPMTLPEGIRLEPIDASVAYLPVCVCMGVNPYWLLEPDDKLEMFENYALRLDGHLLSEPHSSMVVDVSAFRLFENEAVGTADSAEYTYCWEFEDLRHGLHHATINIWSTSKAQDYNYRWSFEVSKEENPRRHYGTCAGLLP